MNICKHCNMPTPPNSPLPEHVDCSFIWLKGYHAARERLVEQVFGSGVVLLSDEEVGKRCRKILFDLV
jgi:hypothetical protein